MDGFYQTYLEIIESIENSLKEQKIVTSLILLYSAIDSFSNLANKSNSNGRSVFIEWVDKWMLNNKFENVTGIDLYAARCGILHAFISESDLSNENKAKQILYAWGTAPLQLLNNSITDSDREEEYVALKLDDLFEAFRFGMSKCYDEIQIDPGWKQSFEDRAAKYFVTINAK